MYEVFLPLHFKEIFCFQECIIGICEPKYIQIGRKALKSPQKHRQITESHSLIALTPPSLVPGSFLPKGGRKTLWKAEEKSTKTQQGIQMV